MGGLGKPSRFNPVTACDALSYCRLRLDNALRHFSVGVLDSPVMDLFQAQHKSGAQKSSINCIQYIKSLGLY